MEDQANRQSEESELLQEGEEGEEDIMDPKRNFKQVDIGSFHRQKFQDRFPHKDGFPPPDLPKVARWRNNLCALSQRFNLFFVVCGDEIHVNIPKNVEHKLSGKPDLIIPIPATLESFGVEGDIDFNNGHYANHIICGNLGNEEIILLSCDDGDVVAFYTLAIWNRITALSPKLGERAPVEVKPLFHENVGVSAWGLSIHEKSRLIAVSTNHSEVHLFGFATKHRPKPAGQEPIDLQTLVAPEVYEELKNGSPLSVDDHRYNGYKSTYQMGVGAHNIPSIAFVSSAIGEAELILASDVRGNLWKVKLWGTGINELAEILSQGAVPGELGWCVLVLPADSFKLAQSAPEALGLDNIAKAVKVRKPRVKNGPGTYLDLRDSVLDLIDQTTRIRLNITGMYKLEKEPADGDSESDEELLLGTSAASSRSQQALPTARRLSTNLALNELINSNVVDPRAWARKMIEEDRALNHEVFRQLVNTIPSMTQTEDQWQNLGRRAIRNVHNQDPIPIETTPESLQASEFHLPSGATILRTFGHSIQLTPPTRGLPRTVCTHLIRHPLRRLPEFLEQPNRLNMCIHLATLHLVVVASQAGDAAILSLTRMESGFSGLGPVVGFRVEHLIPFIKHLPRSNEREILLGIAASRVWGAGGVRVGGESGGERWRILMYFADHSVVSYEVWRGGNGDVVII